MGRGERVEVPAAGVINSSLQPYQQRFVRNVCSVIQAGFLRKHPKLNILDMGCDCSGLQLRHLAELTRGTVTGINIADGFPSAAATENAGPRTKLANMDGTALDFHDQSFDVVVSANVMEHVSSPEKYISECARVLKPGGIAYVETAPVWTSARGHHIHEDMVVENCPDELNYRNDGTVIPDWAHITQSPQQLRRTLGAKLLPTTVDYICWYLFESGDLNKQPWSTVHDSFRRAFTSCRISTWGVHDADSGLIPQGTDEDHNVFGFAATCRHEPPGFISSRLAWRLRRIGL